MAESERPTFSDNELSRPVMALARRFVQRWDIHARQLRDGRYICIHKPLNASHLFAHLRGEITLGTYLLSQKSDARFIVFDADDEQGFSDLMQIAREMAIENIPTYPETSRRGGHLWIFFAQEFGQGILESHEVDRVEIFPKQDRLKVGPGSLIRVPFGLHRLSGLRYDFLNLSGERLEPTIWGQIQELSEPQTIPEIAFEKYRSYAKPISPMTNSTAREQPTNKVSERIKSSVTVLEFVSQFVVLQTTGSGAIGLCPFHDDQHPSFGVNDNGNYWNCFAGCGGGSIIDFWMKWNNCDFTIAVTELTRMLL